MMGSDSLVSNQRITEREGGGHLYGRNISRWWLEVQSKSKVEHCSVMHVAPFVNLAHQCVDTALAGCELLQLVQHSQSLVVSF